MQKFTGNSQNRVNISEETLSPQASDNFPQQRLLDRDVYLHISEISVAMVGVCLTGISILQVSQYISKIATYMDDLLAIDSFVFLTSSLLSYSLVRTTTKGNSNTRKIGNVANFIFLIGMILMAIVCGCIVIKGGYPPSSSHPQ
jgi:uncharacterized membrane protein